MFSRGENVRKIDVVLSRSFRRKLRFAQHGLNNPRLNDRRIVCTDKLRREMFSSFLEDSEHVITVLSWTVSVSTLWF